MSQYYNLSQTIFIMLRAAIAFWDYKIHVPGYDVPFLIRAKQSDWDVFKQIILSMELDHLNAPSPGSLIIDAGANIGISTAYLSRRYPDNTIIAIEPSNENLVLLREHCKGLSNVVIIEGGLWGADAWLEIYNPDAKSWSFRVKEVKENSNQAMLGMRIDTIMKKQNAEKIGILKMDIEGSECDVFSRGVEKWLPQVEQIVVELHGEEAEGIVTNAISDEFTVDRKGEKMHYQRKVLSAVET
ncbi:FkbM family methyltransferase [Poriferisphaera corsica]|uniref:FkbM family methyltransferase n=1 Tax=Poriferisphaera corsica TaxID=2528020 RepID=UPI00190DA3D2|nr:FkbM family methyltransferase [Poriferisphaera corsica]